ncbi:MAG: hypothetical protein ACAI44_02105 [Candidatus Sericytochromatia bacterium]
MNEPPIRHPKALMIIGGLILITIVSQYYFRNLSPEAQAARRFLNEVPVDAIREIRIEPYSVSALTDHVVSISDRGKIKRLADALRTAVPFSANHPTSRWIAILRIVTDGRDYGGQVDATSNGQGVIIWYASGVQGGWNYGERRQDALGPLLESFVKEEGR